MLKKQTNKAEKEKFLALKGTSTALNVVGWIIISISLLSALLGIIIFQEPSSINTAGFIVVIAAIPGFLSGIIFIGIGQLLKCFIGVYSNTWETNEALKKNHKQLNVIRQYLKMQSDE